jgi:hypothetical protein
MNLPGFAAQASLYKTRRLYGFTTASKVTRANGTVDPQRATGPYGPIGLPGQDCSGACFHVCMIASGGRLGPYFDQCMDGCGSTCTGLSFAAEL